MIAQQRWGISPLTTPQTASFRYRERCGMAACSVIGATPIVAPAEAPTLVPPRRDPKILIYSHDAYGLGNIRRTLLLAQTLREEFADAAILMVTGSPVIHSFRIPDRVATPGI